MQPPFGLERGADRFPVQVGLLRHVVQGRPSAGTCTCFGRSDNMLHVNGIYVSPFEVEATLSQHPAILEAAVIGVFDTEGLTKTKAYVVFKSDYDVMSEAELKAFVNERLAP